MAVVTARWARVCVAALALAGGAAWAATGELSPEERCARAATRAVELARGGERAAFQVAVGEAVATANGIRNLEARADAWGAIGAAYAAMGEKAAYAACMTRAINAANDLDEPSRRAGALLAVATHQAVSGDVAGATKTIGGVEDAPVRADMTIRLARRALDAGRAQEAAALVRAAADAVAPLKAGPELAAMRGALAALYAESGDVEGARRAAREIADPAARVPVELAIARRHHAKGDAAEAAAALDAARALAGGIRDGAATGAWLDIAGAELDCGRAAGALTSLKEARRAADALKARDKRRALAAVAELEARATGGTPPAAGLAGPAFTIDMGTATDPRAASHWVRRAAIEAGKDLPEDVAAEVLLTVAKAAIGAGDAEASGAVLPAALAAVEEDDGPGQSAMLADLARAYAARADRAAAERCLAKALAARAEVERNEKANARDATGAGGPDRDANPGPAGADLLPVMMAQAVLGDLAALREGGARIADPNERAHLYLEMATRLAREHQAPAANHVAKLAAETTDALRGPEQAPALIGLARVRAMLGDAAAARAVAARLAAIPPAQARAHLEIARARREAGDDRAWQAALADARAAARTLRGPEAAGTLAGIALELVRGGDRTAAAATFRQAQESASGVAGRDDAGPIQLALASAAARLGDAGSAGRFAGQAQVRPAAGRDADPRAIQEADQLVMMCYPELLAAHAEADNAAAAAALVDALGDRAVAQGARVALLRALALSGRAEAAKAAAAGFDDPRDALNATGAIGEAYARARRVEELAQWVESLKSSEQRAYACAGAAQGLRKGDAGR